MPITDKLGSFPTTFYFLGGAGDFTQFWISRGLNQYRQPLRCKMLMNPGVRQAVKALACHHQAKVCLLPDSYLAGALPRAQARGAETPSADVRPDLVPLCKSRGRPFCLQEVNKFPHPHPPGLPTPFAGDCLPLDVQSTSWETGATIDTTMQFLQSGLNLHHCTLVMWTLVNCLPTELNNTTQVP